MKKQNPDVVEQFGDHYSNGPAGSALPSIPTLRTFIVRTDAGERVVGAHGYEIDERLVVGFFVFFHDPIGGLMQAPRLVVTGPCEIEEINPFFPELANEGH